MKDQETRSSFNSSKMKTFDNSAARSRKSRRSGIGSEPKSSTTSTTNQMALTAELYDPSPKLTSSLRKRQSSAVVPTSDDVTVIPDTPPPPGLGKLRISKLLCEYSVTLCMTGVPSKVRRVGKQSLSMSLRNPITEIHEEIPEDIEVVDLDVVNHENNTASFESERTNRKIVSKRINRRSESERTELRSDSERTNLGNENERTNRKSENQRTNRKNHQNTNNVPNQDRSLSPHVQTSGPIGPISVPTDEDPVVEASGYKPCIENWNPNWRPKVKRDESKTYRYVDLCTLRNRLSGERQRMLPKQMHTFGVVSEILESDSLTSYKFRISDETMQDVLVRIHVSDNEPEVGPQMEINDVIRIHRCCIQFEATSLGQEMVISTSPHHNYVLFNSGLPGSTILHATSANQISFSTYHETRINQLRQLKLNEPSSPMEAMEVDDNTGDPEPVGDIEAEEDALAPLGTPPNIPAASTLHERLLQLPVAVPDVNQEYQDSENSLDGILLSEFGSQNSNPPSQARSSQLYSIHSSVLGVDSVTRGETLLENLSADQRCFTMKCRVLGSAYNKLNNALYIRVSDGTASEKFTFSKFLDGKLSETPQNQERPYVDIVIRKIDTHDDLWKQIGVAETGCALCLLTNIKIIILDEQIRLADLVIDAGESSLERIRILEHSQELDSDDDVEGSQVVANDPDGLTRCTCYGISVHETLEEAETTTTARTNRKPFPFPTTEAMDMNHDIPNSPVSSSGGTGNDSCDSNERTLEAEETTIKAATTDPKSLPEAEAMDLNNDIPNSPVSLSGGTEYGSCGSNESTLDEGETTITIVKTEEKSFAEADAMDLNNDIPNSPLSSSEGTEEYHSCDSNDEPLEAEKTTTTTATTDTNSFRGAEAMDLNNDIHNSPIPSSGGTEYHSCDSNADSTD